MCPAVLTFLSKNSIIVQKHMGRSFALINYNSLWKTCIDKNLKKKNLMSITGISSATVAKLSNNESVSMKTLETICIKLDCNLTDVVSIEKDKGVYDEL